ncbi:N,N-dimethylformamidase beta subunit family domain-containing protein [Sinosporangium siamense]|uniref:N,N-dimethylformamidase beta subunit-like C-terminal domain-containing protein n=1 Tax=Sinosporangium siamense TaxID=1367973 RepID=A0A919V3V6_9ACTN|nr:N,N-dimethylformamidase beta subunit family domain-containing protein [Sinosporangium siamense]GII89883.1 hypothetical protein Ssi02_01140 [Sinosporangium siamense]
MSVRAWCLSTSVAQGETLTFRVEAPGPVRVSVADATDDRRVLTAEVGGGEWALDVPLDWPSSLYRARFLLPGMSDENLPWPRELALPGEGPGPDNEVYFVVRQAVPGSASPILVSIPFTTWEAYNRAGEPGQSVYWSEQPARAFRVEFARPGGGPPPERWEEGLLRWLRPAGYEVEFCSCLDLHEGLDLLSSYRLLIVNGHDEYWSAGMRDAVEEFARRGGNVAILSGNTAWWQIRLEDDRQVMVCYRDPAADPEPDPRLVTAEWSSPSVGRPENTLTGVSFRQGAGTWGPYMKLMREESYRVRFAGHWVFEGTGLADGDDFGRGCLGYETDAAEFEEIQGVPRVTCRDGTSPSFVVLATADLRHWSAFGQGGMATMGVFRLGAGTVFNAATVNWGNTLHDPVVERITRNVIDRLSAPPVPGRWEVIGRPADITALTVHGRLMYGVSHTGDLVARELCGQNLGWAPVGPAPGVLCMDVPREAAAGLGLGLYAATADGRLCYRAPSPHDAPWTGVGAVPPGTVALACGDGAFFAATRPDRLWHITMPELAAGRPWREVGSAGGAQMLSGMNGRIYALDERGVLRTRLPIAGPAEWQEPPCAVPPGVTAMVAHAGLLIVAGAHGLQWVNVPPATPESAARRRHEQPATAGQGVWGP